MTRLFLHTRWRQSHKWDVVDGMVNYGDRLITPREAYESFLVDFPMFDVLRAEVCERLDVEGPRSYRWITLERLD
jgi:hypothetical protein